MDLEEFNINDIEPLDLSDINLDMDFSDINTDIDLSDIDIDPNKMLEEVKETLEDIYKESEA